MIIHKILNKQRLEHLAKFMYGEDVKVAYHSYYPVVRIAVAGGKEEEILINKFAFRLSANEVIVTYMGYSEKLHLAVFVYRGEDG